MSPPLPASRTASYFYFFNLGCDQLVYYIRWVLRFFSLYRSCCIFVSFFVLFRRLREELWVSKRKRRELRLLPLLGLFTF